MYSTWLLFCVRCFSLKCGLGPKTSVSKLFVGSPRMQVEAKSKHDEIRSVCKPRSSVSGMYLFQTVGRIV